MVRNFEPMGAKMKRLALILCLLLPALAWGQAFPLFDPANGILKGSNSTYVTTAATSSDVISLWTGSCSSTTFLRGDGSCQAPGGAGIGTVTSVGLAWTGSGLTVSNSPVTSAGTLTFSGALNVATGGTGATTLTGLLKGNGTSAFTAAASSDVISLWTGTCNSTTFLRGDGSCQSAAGTSANPTASVGLTAVNGVATTFMRSDAAPALSQSITPTWTAQHIFTKSGGGANAAIYVSAANPSISWNETDAAANNRRWDLSAESEQFSLRIINDIDSVVTQAMTFDRTGTTVDLINLLGTTIAVNGANVRDASALFNTGALPDARLSSNVALKNVANQSFSVVGNNSLNIANSSTGQSKFTGSTNGIERFALCSSTSAGSPCALGESTNDTSINFSQKLNVADNSGANIVASFDTAQIDLNATAVNANGSRINTVANSGKTAFGRVTASSGTLTRSLNVTSITKNATGLFDINLTAAGFSSAPVCLVTSTEGNHPAGIDASSTTLATVVVCSNAGATCAGTDIDFNFVCHGQ